MPLPPTSSVSLGNGGRAEEIGLATSLAAGWATLWRYPLPLLGGGFCQVILFAVGFYGLGGLLFALILDSPGDPAPKGANYALVAALAVVLVYFRAGWTRLRLRAAAGEEASLADLFLGGPWLGRSLILYAIFTVAYLGLSIAAGLLVVGAVGIAGDVVGTVVGYGLAVFGVAFLYFRFLFAFWLVVDFNLGVGPALAASWGLTAGKVVTLFAMAVALSLVQYLSTFVFIVGVVVGFALVETVWAEIYASLAWEDVTSPTEGGEPPPPQKAPEDIPQ